MYSQSCTVITTNFIYLFFYPRLVRMESQPILEHSYHPQRNFLDITFQFYPIPSALGNHLLRFLSLNLSVLDSVYKCSHMVSSLLYLASLTEHHVFHVYQTFIFFNCCVNGPRFFNPLSHWCMYVVCCFHLLAIVHGDAMNGLLWVSVWTVFSFLRCKLLGVEWLDHMDTV